MLDGQHEYTITDKRNKKGHRVLRLFYSEAEFWNSKLRGTELLKMVDNGDGVKLSKASKKMNYSKLSELRLLLTFAKSTDKNKVERESKYEIYSETFDNNNFVVTI